MKVKGEYLQRGVVAIEVSIGIIFFMWLIFSWIEICILGFKSSMLDYAISESARIARTMPLTQNEFQHLFYEQLISSDSLWGGILQSSDFIVDVTFFDEVADIAIDMNSLTSDNHPIGKYKITFTYHPVFTRLFLPEDIKFSREVISLQEYGRS